MLRKQKLLVVGLIFAFVATIFSVNALVSHPAAADSKAPNADGTCPTGYTIDKTANPATCTSSPPAGTVNCAVEKIGWFVCPVMEQTAKISDNVFQVLADNFLQTDAGLVANNSGTNTAWQTARNIANVMFIIAFLAIIASQVTGAGINNYGIKKMIPRLLVAAVLVNVSYYICQIAVDVSNILGYEIEDALTQIANSIGPSVFGNAQQLGAFNIGNSWGDLTTTIVVGALATAGVVWLVMGPMMAVVLMVLITALTIVVILLLRKALIVLLIVASPIAFVFYLLPNTEKLFDKWKTMFIQLLMVFPVVGLLFGAGQLASTVILVSGAAKSTNQATVAGTCDPSDIKQKQAFDQGTFPNQGGAPGDYDKCGVKSVVLYGNKDGTAGTTSPSDNGCKGSGCHFAVSWTLGLVALGVAVAPLLAVWSVLKGALSAAGSIGGKVQATISKGGNAAFGDFAKKADENRRKDINRKALDGDLGRGASLTSGYFRNRHLKDEKRDAMLKAAQDEFDARKASTPITDATRTSQLRSNAATHQAQENFVEKIAHGTINIPNAAGQYGAALSGQFEAQQAKAIAEAVKDIEQKHDTSSLDEITSAFEEAVDHGNKIEARALQNLLFTKGAAGFEKYHGIMDGKSGAGTGGVITDLRNNIRSNHGNMTNEDKSIANWANADPTTDTRTLNDHFEAGGTWNGLTAAKLAGQKGHAQIQALAKMDATVRANIIRDLEASPTDLNKIDKGARSTWGF